MDAWGRVTVAGRGMERDGEGWRGKGRRDKLSAPWWHLRRRREVSGRGGLGGLGVVRSVGCDVEWAQGGLGMMCDDAREPCWLLVAPALELLGKLPWLLVGGVDRALLG